LTRCQKIIILTKKPPLKAVELKARAGFSTALICVS